MTLKKSSVLSVLLWLGGVPPVVSGLCAAAMPEQYLAFAGDLEWLGDREMGLVAFLIRLQGGDAFVAGATRIVVAAFGDLRAKNWLGGFAILHSGFEVWLLPTKLIGWCETYPEVGCGDAFRLEVWAFLVLHVVLILGFAGVLILGSEPEDQARA